MTSDKHQRGNHDGDHGGGDLSLVSSEVVDTNTYLGITSPSASADATSDSSEAAPNGSDGSSRRSRVKVESLAAGRIAAAKEGFSTRRVPKEAMRTLVSGAVRPRSGDVVLARVDRVRHHTRIELPTGRRALLDAGDEIILACGNRYATDQFEAFVPKKLGRAHLVAAGGIAGRETARARKMRPATEITLLGLIADGSGLPLNLMSFALPSPEVDRMRPPVVAVLGTSMNSGKTTSARYLTRGLKAAGFRVGYAKLTGTGAGADYWAVLDAGASRVVDFTDAGLASTYMAPINLLEAISINLIGHLIVEGCDRIVVEIADGLLQSETAELIRSDVFFALVDRVVFTAADAMAAIGGVKILQDHGFDVACVSGLLTASPLPVREAAKACGMPVFDKDDLGSPEIAAKLAAYRTGFVEQFANLPEDGPEIAARLAAYRTATRKGVVAGSGLLANAAAAPLSETRDGIAGAPEVITG
jgi:molybdopterin-guanine dinucleotide biosynthesis protein